MAKNPSKRRKIAPLTEVPNRDNDVFLPNPDLPDLTNHMVTFLRASPSVGKSTLGHDLARDSSKYTYCHLNLLQPVENQLVTAIQKVVCSENLTLSTALEKLKQKPGHTLIIDEAHLLFGQTCCTDVLKSGNKILLLSAAAEADSPDGGTPAEVTQKFLWRPHLQVTEDVVKQFQEAGLVVDLKVLKFLANMSAHNKGVFMHIINFFYENSYGCSSLPTAIEQIKRYQHQFNEKLERSRAVHINGGFNVTKNEEFIKVLLKGPSTNIEPRVLRELCIKGALLPVGNDKEFAECNWENENTPWGVSNYLMAKHYVDTLKNLGYNISWPQDASSCSDLIVRALPYMGFAKVVQPSIFGHDGAGNETFISNLSGSGLPHEDHYNMAFWSCLGSFYDVGQQKGSKTGVGNPGLAVTVGKNCFVIETVLCGPGIEDHRNRFDTKAAYNIAKFQCLLIIGPDEDKVLDAVKNTRGEKVEIVGAVVTHSHHEYRVFVKQAGGGSSLEGPFVIPCDCVARSLKPNPDGKLELQCCQEYTPPTGPSEVWVRWMHNSEAGQGPFINADEEPFLARGSLRHIDDLKNRIEEKIKLTPKRIYLQGEDGTWKNVSPDERVISGKTVASSYGFVVSTAST